jgi:hypothetical protein
MNVRKWTPEVEQKIYDEFKYKPTLLQMALIEMAWKSSISWTHAFSGTFTKQAFIKIIDVDLSKKELADKLCYEFINCLNSKCGKPNWKRKCKKQPSMRLPSISIVEGDGDFTHYHCHFLLAAPRPMIDSDFGKIIESTWSKISDCGSCRNKLKPIDNLTGWVKYISKELKSSQMTAIQLEATHLY